MTCLWFVPCTVPDPCQKAHQRRSRLGERRRQEKARAGTKERTIRSNKIKYPPKYQCEGQGGTGGTIGNPSQPFRPSMAPRESSLLTESCKKKKKRRWDEGTGPCLMG